MPAPRDRARARDAGPEPAHRSDLAPPVAPETARILALQRSAGNAAVGALLQRYLFHVPAEGRDVPYHEGAYDPSDKTNIAHMGDRSPDKTGEKAVYKDAQKGPVAYPAAHAEDHERVIKVADELISLLIRRADRGISSKDKMYMIGVIEHVDVLKQHTEGLKRYVAARSAAQPASFKEAVKALASLHPEFAVENAEKLPAPDEAQKIAPGITLTGEGLRATLKDCAAKKLVLSVPPVEKATMTEILYDPEGEHPVEIEDEKGIKVRYHHRQRVPSCSDCLKNLPHLHKAMDERLKTIKQATQEALPLTEKPLKAEELPAFPVIEPQVLAPDTTIADWARTALAEAPPKRGGTPLDEIEERLVKARKEFQDWAGRVEGGLLDRQWFDKMAKTTPRSGNEPSGADRITALAPVAEAGQAIIKLFEGCDKLLKSKRMNPFLHTEASGVKEVEIAVLLAIEATKSGEHHGKIKAAEEQTGEWLKGRGPLPQKQEKLVPGLERPLDDQLAGDKEWQVFLMKSEKPGTVTVPVNVDEKGHGAIKETPAITKLGADVVSALKGVVTRLVFKQNQPGTTTIKLEYGKKQ